MLEADKAGWCKLSAFMLVLGISKSLWGFLTPYFHQHQIQLISSDYRNLFWKQKGFSPSFQNIMGFHPILLLTSVTLGKLPHLFVSVSRPFPCPNENTSPLGWSDPLPCVCVVVIEWQQSWFNIHQSPSSLKSREGDTFSRADSDLSCILFAKGVYVGVLNKKGLSVYAWRLEKHSPWFKKK